MKKESQNTQGTQGDKLIKENMLVMDINAIPIDHGMDSEQWARIIRTDNICFYDSVKGDKPTFMNVDSSIKVFDVQDEIAMSALEDILKGKDPVEVVTAASTVLGEQVHFDNHLTEREVGQLEIDNPLSSENVTRVDTGFTSEENEFMDRTMSGINLIDDTE